MQYLFSLLGIYLYIRLWLLMRYHTTSHCDSLGLPMLDLPKIRNYHPIHD